MPTRRPRLTLFPPPADNGDGEAVEATRRRHPAYKARRARLALVVRDGGRGAGERPTGADAGESEAEVGPA